MAQNMMATPSDEIPGAFPSEKTAAPSMEAAHPRTSAAAPGAAHDPLDFTAEKKLRSNDVPQTSGQHPTTSSAAESELGRSSSTATKDNSTTVAGRYDPAVLAASVGVAAKEAALALKDTVMPVAQTVAEQTTQATQAASDTVAPMISTAVDTTKENLAAATGTPAQSTVAEDSILAADELDEIAAKQHSDAHPTQRNTSEEQKERAKADHRHPHALPFVIDEETATPGVVKVLGTETERSFPLGVTDTVGGSTVDKTHG